jgi:putative oxidoreductase
MKNFNANATLVNRVLIGLLFLVAGLVKLFQYKPSGVAGMLAGLGFPAAMFFAWVLILAELLGGIAILANWKVKYASYLLIVVMIVAAFTSYWANWVQMLFHLVVASNLWILSTNNK